MVLVGVLYLTFEKRLLAKTTLTGNCTTPVNNRLSRSLIAIQVSYVDGFICTSDVFQIGFIILSMVVTRSSVISLQAKLGLPRGNQIVGWLVLGKNGPPLEKQHTY